MLLSIFFLYISKKIAKEFQLNLDLGEFDSISTGYGKNGKYFAHNGTLTSVRIKRNHCKDSKAIDGVAYFQNKDNGNYLELFFFFVNIQGSWRRPRLYTI